jgi:hypothetical protein
VDVEEILLRFVVGGAVVSVFALVGDLLKPKTFAGLFGAAPSVALATLVLKQGKGYVSIEGRSVLVGAVALFFYASLVSRLLIGRKLPVLAVTSLSMTVWFGSAFGLWYTLLR